MFFARVRNPSFQGVLEGSRISADCRWGLLRKSESATGPSLSRDRCAISASAKVSLPRKGSSCESDEFHQENSSGPKAHVDLLFVSRRLGRVLRTRLVGPAHAMILEPDIRRAVPDLRNREGFPARCGGELRPRLDSTASRSPHASFREHMHLRLHECRRCDSLVRVTSFCLRNTCRGVSRCGL